MQFPLVFRLFLILFWIAAPLSAASPSAAQVDILVLGDSLTAGYGLEQGDAFPAQLEKRLQLEGYDVNVINASVSGDTTAGGLARIEWALADQPQIVVVELGANDALRGLDPDHVYKNLDDLLTRLGEAGCRVLLAGMNAPRNLGPEYYIAFDRIYPELAKRHEVMFYPFFLEGVATEAELNQADGIHPNPAGVELIVTRIQPLIAALLDQLGASKVVK